MEFIALVILVCISFLTYKYIKNRKTQHTDSTAWDLVEQGIIANLPGPGTYSLDIVGESRYQKALKNICGGYHEDGVNEIVQAALIHDDDNPFDHQAIRVDIEGKTVGYLKRDDAREFRRQFKEAGYPGINATCSVKIVGGWNRGDGDRGHFGVKLDLPIKKPNILKEIAKHSVGEVIEYEFYVDKVNSAELEDCAVGDLVNLWMASQTNKIIVFRHGTVGGAGKIGNVPDEYFGEIAPSLLGESDLGIYAQITELGLISARYHANCILKEDSTK